MIYRNSYFEKEVRQAYIDREIGFKRKLFFAIFVGLVSLSLFFVLQTLKQSVLSDTVPELMQQSFFSTVYIYIHVAAVALAVYCGIHYDYLFFSEIRRNAWYLLIKMRYRPAGMIVQKVLALFYSMLLIYTIGFLCIVLLTVFLKYTLVLAYLPSLYIAGLTDILMITVFCALVSLYTSRREDARLLIAAASIVLYLLKYLFGAYGILRNRVTLQEFKNLFDITQSWYFPVAVIVLAACVLAVLLRAQKVARLYWAANVSGNALPEGVTVVLVDAKTGKRQQPPAAGFYDRHRKLLSTAFTALCVAFIMAALALNVLIILISTATPGNEVTIRGIIPYVFRSDTMQPSIMINDLAYFKKVDAQYPVKEKQIVLFKENNIVYIERILQKSGDTIEVDIDHYPPAAMPGAMRKQIQRSAIYGVYNGRSRGLGALILFANTIIGRLLFLFVPSVLLFYRGQIAALIKKYRSE